VEVGGGQQQSSQLRESVSITTCERARSEWANEHLTECMGAERGCTYIIDTDTYHIKCRCHTTHLPVALDSVLGAQLLALAHDEVAHDPRADDTQNDGAAALAAMVTRGYVMRLGSSHVMRLGVYVGVRVCVFYCVRGACLRAFAAWVFACLRACV
jgi:hypothetical protein